MEIHPSRSSDMIASALWMSSEIVVRDAFSTSPREFHQERRLFRANTARVYLGNED